MALENHIRRRAGGRYSARLRVPLDLVDVIGKKELWKSCETANPADAKIEKARIVAGWRAWFTALRQQRTATEHDMRRAVHDHFREEIDRLHRHRLAQQPKAELDAQMANATSSDDIAQAIVDTPDFWRDLRDIEMEELKHSLAIGDTTEIEPTADKIIKRERWAISKGTPEYRRLCHDLGRSKLEALKIAAAHDEGRFDAKPTDEIVQPPPDAPATEIAPPGETIMEIYEQFAVEQATGTTADTLDQNRKVMQRFAEFVGEATSVRSISKAHVREWKKALFLWPVKAAEIKEFRHLTFKEIIKANETVGKPTITPKTINRYLSALGAFCRWLTASGYIDANPVTDLYLEIDKSEPKVFPYSTAQLNTIFSSPVFTGAKSDIDDHLPGQVRIDGWRRWLPLLALYTGARLGELAQLYVDDVTQDRGHWIIKLTKEGARDKKFKTKGSERIIPIHAELIACGFLDFHAAAKARKEQRLFPDLTPDSRGHISGKPSRWYGRYVQAIGVKEDRSVNFHSFRHGLADAFRRAGYLDAQFKFMLGHSQGNVTGRYGSLPEGELRLRVTMIEAVSFPGLDLNHLHMRTAA